MKIEKIGSLYIARGRFNSHFFTSVENSFASAINKIIQEIAIFRSVEAWKGYKYPMKLEERIAQFKLAHPIKI